MKTVRLLPLALWLAALPALAQETRPVPSPLGLTQVPALTVSGDGESRVAPDEATVRLGVLAQAQTARGAQEQVNRSANAILAAVRKLGVAAEEIQTSELNLNPLYAQARPGEDGEPRITGYQASNVVTVRLRKLDLVGPVIDAGLAAGANRLDGVSFGLVDDRAARGEALTAAANAAKAKAQALAKALNVRLVQILEAVEGGIQVVQPVYRGRMAMEAAMAADSTPVAAGQVGVNATVTLRWEIAPCPAQGSCS
jgi:uncharacterized protein YggE